MIGKLHVLYLWKLYMTTHINLDQINYYNIRIASERLFGSCTKDPIPLSGL